MKLFVFGLLQTVPALAWVGDWALRWTEGNEALQIAFVMFIFPVLMNALQYYIIDSFIKQQGDVQSTEGFERVPTNEDDYDVEHDNEESAYGDSEERVAGISKTTKEANTTAVPVYDDPADVPVVGSSGSGARRR